MNTRQQLIQELEHSANKISAFRASKNRTGVLKALAQEILIFTRAVGKLGFDGMSYKEILSIPSVKKVIEDTPKKEE